MRSSSGTRSRTSSPSARISSSACFSSWSWKHRIAFGSHCLRFRVRHRQVTKARPRAHLGSLGDDHLRLVLHRRRPRPADEAGSEQLKRNFVVALQLLPGCNGAVNSRELWNQTYKLHRLFEAVTSRAIMRPQSIRRRIGRRIGWRIGWRDYIRWRRWNERQVRCSEFLILYEVERLVVVRHINAAAGERSREPGDAVQRRAGHRFLDGFLLAIEQEPHAAAR